MCNFPCKQAFRHCCFRDQNACSLGPLVPILDVVKNDDCLTCIFSPSKVPGNEVCTSNLLAFSPWVLDVSEVGLHTSLATARLFRSAESFPAALVVFEPRTGRARLTLMLDVTCRLSAKLETLRCSSNRKTFAGHKNGWKLKGDAEAVSVQLNRKPDSFFLAGDKSTSQHGNNTSPSRR